MNLKERVDPSEVTKICRICLKEERNMYSVFNRSLVDIYTNELPISEVLSIVANANVSEDDDMPHLLCSNCTSLLQHAFRFKQLFEHSFKVLQQYLFQFHFSRNKNVEICSVESSDDMDYDSNIAESFTKSVRKTKSIHRNIKNDKNSIVKTESVIDILEEPVVKLEQSVYRTGESEEVNVVSLNCILRNNNQHVMNENVPVLHPCPICMKEFPALELREHAKSHKALKKYLNIKKTVKSDTKFYTIFDPLKAHMTVHQRAEKLHKCVFCCKEFTVESLRSHIQLHGDEKSFSCDQCPRVFKKLNHLSTHRVSHLKECPYKCDHCGKGFVIKKNYDCHVLTHNLNQELPHECSYCQKRFSNPEHLKRHMFIHIENRSYWIKYKMCKCNRCLLNFSDRDEMKRHRCRPIKPVEGAYSCNLCDKVFKSGNSVYNHHRNVHKMKGEKTLCSVCGKYVSNIYNHMSCHTDERNFQCSECGKKFLTKPQLNKHLLVHSGLKPFVCSVCAKAFNNLYNLQVHERIHKGDRCHVCPVCNKGFLEKSYLKKHMIVHKKVTSS